MSVMKQSFPRFLSALLLLLSATSATQRSGNAFLRCNNPRGCLPSRHKEDPIESNAESVRATIAPGTPTDSCSVNEQGDFGSNFGYIVTIHYPYQIETTKEISEVSVLRSNVVGEIERAVGNSLLPSLFPDQCALSSRSAANQQEASVVYGISSYPPDVVAQAGTCAGSVTTNCFLFDGLATVFVQEGTDSSAIREKTQAIIKDLLNVDLLNNTHRDIVGISFRSADPSPDQSNKTSDISLIWLWVFLGILGVSLCLVLKIVSFRAFCSKKSQPMTNNDADSLVYSDNAADFVPSQEEPQRSRRSNMTLKIARTQSTDLGVILEEEEEDIHSNVSSGITI